MQNRFVKLKFILVRFAPVRENLTNLTRISRLWAIQETYNMLGLDTTSEVSFQWFSLRASVYTHLHFRFTGGFLLKFTARKEKFLKTIYSKSFILPMGNWGFHTWRQLFKITLISKMSRGITLSQELQNSSGSTLQRYIFVSHSLPSISLHNPWGTQTNRGFLFVHACRMTTPRRKKASLISV